MSDEKPPEPPGKSTPVASQNELPLAELIAKTPGAQTREQLLERIKARERMRPKKSQQSAPSEEQLTEREPLPMIDDPKYLTGFVKRLQAKEQEKQLEAKQNEKCETPKGKKLHIVVDNDKAGPRDKK